MINSYLLTHSMGIMGHNRNEKGDSDRRYKLPRHKTKEVQIKLFLFLFQPNLY